MGPPTVTVQETANDFQLRLTLLFGKKFYNWNFKGGMLESRGGLGVEYNFFRDRMRFSFDAFDFENPNLRAYLRYSFFKGIYVVGGAPISL